VNTQQEKPYKAATLKNGSTGATAVEYEGTQLFFVAGLQANDLATRLADGLNTVYLIGQYDFHGNSKMDIKAILAANKYSCKDGKILYAGADVNEGWTSLFKDFTRDPRLPGLLNGAWREGCMRELVMELPEPPAPASIDF